MMNNIHLRTIAQTSFKGMSKQEIIKELGDSFNFFPDDILYYELSKNWFGLKKVLCIVFENDRVLFQCIKKTYGKITTTRLP